MRKRLFAALITSCLILPAQGAEGADGPIHDELRGLLHRVEEAVNSERYGSMADCFTERCAITTINQEVLSSRSEIEPYFRKWFGPGGRLKKLRMKLKADALTELNAERNAGVVRGSGEEDYILSDSRFFPMRTRWTALVVKDGDGHWRIRAIHIGTDFLDNPLLAKAEQSLGWAAGLGMALGIAAGLALGWALLRRRRG